jgi:hypothetical protein
MSTPQKKSGKSGRIKLGAAITITGAVHATGVVTVTAAAHGLMAGQFVLISGVTGMTDLNNGGKGHLVVAAPTSDTFTVNLTTSQTYSGTGATAQRIIPISEWNANLNSEFAEVTDSESGDWKEKIVAGHKEWDGDYSGFEYEGADLPPFGEALDVELDISPAMYYKGNAIFNGVKTGAKVTGSDAVGVSGTFTGNGPLTKTRTAA